MDTNEILSILPQKVQSLLRTVTNKSKLQEIRIKTNRPIILCIDNEADFKLHC